MAESGNDSKDSSKDAGKPKPNFSPFSPFPYGSPLAQGSFQTSFSGSPGQRLLLGSLSQTRTNGDVITPRLKGQDLYGGPVMFGGLSTARRTRLQAASPYSAAMRNRNAERKARQGPLTFPPALGVQNSTLPPSSLPSTAPSSPQSSPGPSTTPPAPLSSTAKLILSTLDRLSSGGTPITDARKIPVSTPNRAEKRKLLETELNCSLSSPSRRRARLGGGGLALSLAGPPLRKNYSPSLAGSQRAQPQPKAPFEQVKTVPAREPRLPAANPATCGGGPRSSALPASTDTGATKVKSSFKVKSKVTESARQRVDLSSAEPPPSPPSKLAGLPQLQLDQLPVLNFSPAAQQQPPPPATSNGVSAPPHSNQDISERNNNKSPLKRVIEEKEKCDSPKKQKSGGVGGFGFCPTELVKPNHENFTSANGSLIPEKVACAVPVKIIQPSSSSPSSPVSSTSSPPPSFSFSAPKSVMGRAKGVPEAVKSFSFSPPSVVKSDEKVSNGPSREGSAHSVRLGSGLVNTNTSLNTNNFKFNNLSSMPDVTNNLVKKSPSKDKLKGSSSRLPDITASTGFGGFIPAKELKTGSVMDILGKKA